MPSSTGRLTPREQALRKLLALQRKEIAHYLATGEPPNAERPGGTPRGAVAKDAAE